MRANKCLLILFILVAFAAPSYAMQTVFNVPSADVMDQGKVMLQEEVQAMPWSSDTVFINTIYSAVGVGHNTEVGVNLFNVASPATGNISLSTGFKSAIPIPGLDKKFPDREFKFTVGSEVLVGLEGNGVGNWTYGHLSGRLPKLNTRLTAGVSYGGRQVFGQNSVSFIGAVEQPLTKKLTAMTEWYSGNEQWAGYLIVGGSYKLPKSTTLYAGYQIPNSPKVGSSGFIIQVAKYF